MSKTTEMPEEIWARALRKEHFSCVRKESRLIAENLGGRMEYTRYVRADTVKLKCFYEDEPHGKFVALYADGSGCEMFYETKEGVFRQVSSDMDAVDKHWFADAGYLWWMPLPDNFDIWE